MPFIPFPNIPSFPGVPDIPRLPDISNLPATIIGIVGNILQGRIDALKVWGIFDEDGKPLADSGELSGGWKALLSLGSVRSTISFEHNKSANVSDFPIERGSFASYNKVELPAEAKVTLALSATDSRQQAFLALIDGAVISNDLYSIVTPQAVYVDYSIISRNYTRFADAGVNLLVVDLVLKQIRQVSPKFTESTPIESPKNPEDGGKVDNGKVQPKQSTLGKIVDAALEIGQ
jgi:hypothetical protein